MVIMVLLKLAFTWATPAVMFLRSLLRMRCGAWAIGSYNLLSKLLRTGGRRSAYFFLPAIGLALPLRVRALVCVRWPRTGRPLRWRSPREQARALSRLMFIPGSRRR